MRIVLLAAALLTATATCVAFSGLHRFDNSDNLIPVLMSLQKWTLFYWDQARLGVPNALIAWPVRNPLWNLIVQTGLVALWTLSALFLLPSHLRRPDVRLAVGAASGVLLLVLLPPFEVFRLFMHHYEYGTSLALGAAGLWAVEGAATGRRTAAGVALLALSLWVNLSVALVLVPLHFTRRLMLSEGPSLRARLASRGTLLGLTLLAGLFVLNLLLIRGLGLEQYGLVSFEEWMRDPTRLGLNGARAFFSEGLGTALGALLLLGLAMGLVPAGREALLPAARAALPLLVAAAVYLLAMMAIGHIARSAEARYAMAALLLVVTAVSTFTWTVADALRPGWTRAAALVLLVLLPLAAARVDGLHSARGVQAIIEQRWGARAREADQGRATHVGGSYWDSWPIVHLIMIWRHDEGRSLPIFGATQRCEPTRPQWTSIPRADVRFALFRTGRGDLRRITDSPLWPVRLTGETPTFLWWEPVSRTTPSPG